MSYSEQLREMFEQYVLECQFAARLSPESIRGYKEVFSLFIRLMPEITSLSYLSPEVMNEFFMRLQNRIRLIGRDTLRKGVKNSTIRTYRSKLHSFFDWLRLKGLIIHNPLTNLKPPKIIYEDGKTLSETEIQKLYSAVTLHSKTEFLLRRNICMISLLYFTGIRLSEFISIQAQDIDMNKRLLVIKSTTSKSKRTRYIPIHTTLLLHLKSYITERNKMKYTASYLFVSANTDRELTRHGLKHWVANLNKKSGVKFHIHQFRHTFAHNLATKNVNAIKIQKLLGHRSLMMTMTYLRSIGTEDLKNDIQKLSL